VKPSRNADSTDAVVRKMLKEMASKEGELTRDERVTLMIASRIG
jgi:Ca2+-binding EF-hand superfamily protein